MPLNWLDLTTVSFNTILLFEKIQLSWFPGWLPENDLAVALKANPVVEWYLRQKCQAISPWVDQVMTNAPIDPPTPEKVRESEISVLRSVEDLVVYAIAPNVYDAQPFMNWDSSELSCLVDFNHKIVVDVGAGTGRLTFIASPEARVIYAVEPVANLRDYIREKAHKLGCSNVFPVDGLITNLPFSNEFADVVMCGHVFGDDLVGEYNELMRITRIGGKVILCPGTGVSEETAHLFLVEQDFSWAWFEEPRDGMKRKYWKTR